MIEAPLHRKAEKLARKISKKAHGTEGLWQLYLIDAYREVTVNQIPEEPHDEH